MTTHPAFIIVQGTSNVHAAGYTTSKVNPVRCMIGVITCKYTFTHVLYALHLSRGRTATYYGIHIVYIKKFKSCVQY